MRYWPEAALVGIGAALVLLGASVTAGDMVGALVTAGFGAFLAAVGLFRGIEWATRSAANTGRDGT